MKHSMVIIGSTGRLGDSLVRSFSGDWECHLPTRKDLDIGRPIEVDDYISSVRPRVVLLAAAKADVGWCQANPDEAALVNSAGPACVARACAKIGSYLVYYSTDYVFDGAATSPYSETAGTRPLSAYGRTKLTGEQAVLESGADSAIIRVSRLYGVRGDNFVTRLLKGLADQSTANLAGRPVEPIKVVDDLIAAPTSTDEVARQTVAMVEARGNGVYHCSSEAPLSLFQFANEIVALSETWSDIAPCSAMEYYGEDIRPHYSVLANERLRREGLLVMRPHEEALRDCYLKLVRAQAC